MNKYQQKKRAPKILWVRKMSEQDVVKGREKGGLIKNINNDIIYPTYTNIRRKCNITALGGSINFGKRELYA